MRQLIGLAGYAGCGKDTIAARLRGYTRLAFADELKRRAAVALGTDVETIERRKAELRPALVAIGAGARAIDPLVWVRVVEDQIVRTPSHIVVTDVRYLNEAHMIHARGGIVVYVQRDGVSPANDEEARTMPDVIACADRFLINDDPAIAARKLETP